MRIPNLATFVGVGVLVSMASTPFAHAADLAARAPPAPPVLTTGFFSGIEFHAQGEAGILGNSSNPSQGLFAPDGIQGTTYSEITLGVTIKPDVPKPLALVSLRPEVRYDQIVAGGAAYDNAAYRGGFGGRRNRFLFGGDVIIGF